jgi:hypothetical protein
MDDIFGIAENPDILIDFTLLVGFIGVMIVIFIGKRPD